MNPRSRILPMLMAAATLAAMSFGAQLASAGEAPLPKNPVPVTPMEFISLDQPYVSLFAVYRTGQADSLDGEAGFGAAIGYSLTEGVDLEVSTTFTPAGDLDLSNAVISSIFYLPKSRQFGPGTLKPYAVTGVGYDFISNSEKLSGTAGLGFRWEPTVDLGLFADAAHCWAESTDTFLQFRAGAVLKF